MTSTEARRIMQSLADGRCPQTGQVLPADSPYQTADVVRALLIAIRGLELAERRETRDATLPEHAGKSWDIAEDQQLCQEFDAGTSIAQLAQMHERTKGAIQSRLEKLGKMQLRARSMSQRDKMRELYREHGGDEAQIIRAYAVAEERGEVTRESDSFGLSALDYAARLFADGNKKGWIQP
jgi:hypothetical protein